VVQDVEANRPKWDLAVGRPVVFLLDASSALEERLLRDWVAANAPEPPAGSAHEIIALPPSRRRGKRRLDPRLEACLATDEDPLLFPLRVAWQPPNRDGRRAVLLSDLLTLTDPRDPGRLQQSWIARRHPDRCPVVAGEPATLSDLRARWRDAGGADAELTTGLPEYVARQAALALERAERRLRGARYKVPRLVHEDILARPGFRGGVARLARQTGQGEEKVAARASRYLREIAATHSTYVIDLLAHVIHYLYRQGYEEALHYDRERLERIYAQAQRHPVVFLPSHKSNLDHLVLQYALHENGHPPNHTAGGINMNFFPVGPLVRRSGVFFIRRTFKDNPIYKFVLRQYVDYLIEKRFPLEWYVEGGRSRSGKMLPPRFGMLAWVIDAFRRGKSEDVLLIPVSIAYDQIQDVSDYVAEQRGAAKQRESFGWFLGVVRALRRRYGRIHLSFGEPLSLAEALGPETEAIDLDAEEHGLDLQKLAFEVCVRINRVTPITPTSLVTLALLGTLEKAMTVDEIVAALKNMIVYVQRRSLPTTEAMDLDNAAAVQRTLDGLVENGVVACFSEGPEAVYMIGPEQHLTAAYYRNTIIHFFVNGAIVELALLRAGDARRREGEGAPDAVDVFWDEAFRLRDLLKFEFFFADKETFRREIADELALHAPDWERELGSGDAQAAQSILRRIKPFNAHRILRPFLEAYSVVADALVPEAAGAKVDEKALLSRCLSRGRQYLLQRRIRSTESVSKVLFETSLKLARNRGLLDPAVADVAERRRRFAEEIRDVLRRIDAIGALAASRIAGLID
jgi:glycerol-3-phosphate O-acyltransferase